MKISLDNFLDGKIKIYQPIKGYRAGTDAVLLAASIKTFKGYKILDIGSGAGHFLKALEIKKINSLGLEPNETLVNLGNKKLKKNKLLKTDEKYFKSKILEKNNFNVMSLIAVLEHLNDPHSILKSFSKSKIKYLYISVPLFSLSTFLENSFKKIFPRHLGGAHTHLFTEKSINYLKKKYKLKSVGEWWFGTDFPDLYRSILNSSTYFKNQYVDHLDKNLFSVINQLQNVLDKNKICSEVHLILKK